MEDLIVRSLQRRTSPEEESQLQAWRESAWENQQQYAVLAELWSLTGEAGPVYDEGVPVDVDDIIARAEAQDAVDAVVERDTAGTPHHQRSTAASVFAVYPSDRTPARRARWTRRVAVGALAASLAGLSFGLGFFSSGLLGPNRPLAYSEVTTGATENAMVTFSDNTAVQLGPESNLRLLEDGENPVVWLEGRAFFGVVPNPSRTFTVRTPYGEAIALGTRFEVRTDEREFRVLVVQGDVRVVAAGSSVELGEGMISQSGDGAPPLTSPAHDMNVQLDWMGQTLVFRATPLSRVISEIEQRYDTTLDLEDDALGDVTVTATFDDQPVESVVFVVCEIVGAGCVAENGRFRLGDPLIVRNSFH